MSSYFLTFIDDFSRMCWVYFLKNKDEAFEFFKEFKEMVENESEYKIKCVRSDRGGEYSSTDFSEFCKQNGIKRQFTTAYTPQHNGVAERKNRTLMEMARCLMQTKKLHYMYWAEVVKTQTTS